MTAQKGAAFLLKIGDGGEPRDEPPAAVLVCGDHATRTRRHGRHSAATAAGGIACGLSLSRCR